jgi:capsular polysaccharide biosynthesis protein
MVRIMNQKVVVAIVAAVLGLVFAATIVQTVDARRSQNAVQVAVSGEHGQSQNVANQQQGRHNSAIVIGIQHNNGGGGGGCQTCG